MAKKHKSAQRPAIQRIAEGTTVFDAGGEKIGTVSEHNMPGGYLDVRKGWLFPKDIYVPVTAIRRTDTTGIYLRVGTDELGGQEWETPPLAPSAASTARQTRSQRSAGTHQAQEQTTGEDVRVPVVEEQLVAATRAEEMGHVRVHKEVVEERQTITAPVTHEEVHVERVGVQRQPVLSAGDAFTAAEIEVPVMGEELVTSKRAVVVEEVRLHKEAVTEQQQVTDTVRKERVTVDQVDATPSPAQGRKQRRR